MSVRTDDRINVERLIDFVTKRVDERVGLDMKADADNSRTDSTVEEMREHVEEFLKAHGHDPDAILATRLYLDVRYDVTDLTEAERGHLALEAAVIAEASDADDDSAGHPDVEVTQEWNEVAP